MKIEQVSQGASAGNGRVMEIIVYLVGEIRRNKQIGDIDLAQLSKKGFTDTEVSTAQLAQPIEKTRRLITGLLNAVGLAGSSYAKEYEIGRAHV